MSDIPAPPAFPCSRTATTTTPPAATQSLRIGYLCVVATAVGWGLNWPATKMLLAECPPLTARGIAGLVSCVLLAALARVRGESLRVPNGQWGRLFGGAVLNVSAWMGLTTVSMLWLPAGQAATLAYTMPVWAALLAWPVLGDVLSPRQAFATVLGLCGVVVLVGTSALTFTAVRLPGIVLALSASWLFATGTVLSKRYPVRMPRLAMTAWQVGIGCVPLLIAGLALEDAHFESLPMIGWVALAYTALVSMGACYLLWFAAVRHLPASRATLGTLLTPVIGVVASTLVLGDAVTIQQIASLLLVGGGILLAVRD